MLIGIRSAQIVESGKYMLDGLNVITEDDWNSDNQLEKVTTNIDIID